MDSKCFVLRQHYEEADIRNELYAEIKRGRFRQGWGIKNLDLKQAKDEWIKNWLIEAKEQWGEDVTLKSGESRYWILYPMLEIKYGDVILVPKQPTDDIFILAQATERDGKVYYFDYDYESNRGVLGKDFRHVICIEPESLKEFLYEENANTLLVKKKIRGYQKAVNNIWDEEFKKTIFRLWEIFKPSKAEHPTGVTEIVNKAISDSDIYGKVLEKLRNIPPGKLEELVENMFSKGDELNLIASHVHDKGGDVDRIFELPIYRPSILEMISPDIGPPIKLNVQIKQKMGIDFYDKQGVEQLIKMSSGAINEYNILISTADDFTEECKKLAEQNSVILINGFKLAEIFIKNS